VIFHPIVHHARLILTSGNLLPATSTTTAKIKHANKSTSEEKMALTPKKQKPGTDRKPGEEDASVALRYLYKRPVKDALQKAKCVPP
jgi:hypothetical protein